MSPRGCYLDMRRQILEGRTSWGVNDYGGDAKLFQIRCLTPLERLSEVYGDLHMHYVYRARRRSDEITSVHIIGSVDHLSVLKGV
jgi:hypothetical protein